MDNETCPTVPRVILVMTPLISNAGRIDHGDESRKTNLAGLAGCLMLEHGG
jgi:hypothetical protein